MTDKKPKKTFTEIMNAARSKVTAIQDAAEHVIEATPAKVFLPGMSEIMRAMPNHIARSSLFAPVAPGHKKMHDNTVLVSRADAVIRFNGKQLDESQADVWMQAMYEAIKHPLGEPFVINRAAFLHAIGRTRTGPNYKWLLNAMKELSFGMLVIEVRQEGKTKMSIGRTRALHLISGFDYDEKAGNYTLQIDPRWSEMYKSKEYARIDWEKRMQFGQNQNMAKSLQRLIATSSDTLQRHGLDYLKDKMEYSGRMRDFADALEKAMLELQRLGIIAGGRIEASTRGTEQTVWTRL